MLARYQYRVRHTLLPTYDIADVQYEYSCWRSTGDDVSRYCSSLFSRGTFPAPPDRFQVQPHSARCKIWTHTHTQSGASSHLSWRTHAASKTNWGRTILISLNVVVFHTRDVGLLRPTALLARYVEGCDLFRYWKHFIRYAGWKEQDKLFSGKQPFHMNYKIQSFGEELHSIIRVKGNSAQVLVVRRLVKNSSIMLHNKRSETFSFWYVHPRQTRWCHNDKRIWLVVRRR